MIEKPLHPVRDDDGEPLRPLGARSLASRAHAVARNVLLPEERSGSRRLLLATVVACLALGAAAVHGAAPPSHEAAVAAPASEGEIPRSAERERGEFVDALLLETNRVRREHRLQPLSLSEDLSAAAQAHAEDMLERGYFDHLTPEQATPADRVMKHAPLAIVLGVRENIAMTEGGEPETVKARAAGFVQRWMNSKGHRENLLNGESMHVGFGSASGSHGDERFEYAVQLFGVVAGHWRRPPGRAVHAQDRWSASLSVPLEFYVEDLSRPERRYAVPSRPRLFSIGGVPLVVSGPDASRVIELPSLAPGPYRLLARRAGEEGYQFLRALTVLAP